MGDWSFASTIEAFPIWRFLYRHTSGVTSMASCIRPEGGGRGGSGQDKPGGGSRVKVAQEVINTLNPSSSLVNYLWCFRPRAIVPRKRVLCPTKCTPNDLDTVLTYVKAIWEKLRKKQRVKGIRNRESDRDGNGGLGTRGVLLPGSQDFYCSLTGPFWSHAHLVFKLEYIQWRRAGAFSWHRFMPGDNTQKKNRGENSIYGSQ